MIKQRNKSLSSTNAQWHTGSIAINCSDDLTGWMQQSETNYGIVNKHISLCIQWKTVRPEMTRMQTKVNETGTYHLVPQFRETKILASKNIMMNICICLSLLLIINPPHPHQPVLSTSEITIQPSLTCNVGVFVNDISGSSDMRTSN